MSRTKVQVKQVQYLENVTSDVQTQINARLLAAALKKTTDTLDWTDDTVTATLKAIEAKINSMIASAAVGGAVYQGGWSSVPSSGIKKGWMYVYDSGTVPTGVTLEAGDMLIANKDSADKTAAADWTVLQTNLSAAVTSASSSSVDGQLAVFSGTSGKVIKKFDPTFNGLLFQTAAGVVICVVCTIETLTITGSVGAQTATLSGTPLPASLMIFVNGVLQKEGVDYTISSAVVTFLGWNTDNIDLSGYVVTASFMLQV